MQSLRQRIIRKLILRRQFRDYILIVIGVLCAGLGLKGFLLPNNFLDGGVTGISLIVNTLTGIDLPLLIILINLPFVVLGMRQVSFWFGMKTLMGIIGLAICLIIIPYPIVTQDKLLIAVFGGFFLGAGIGLSIRGGAVIDGTEVLAVFVSRNTSLTVGDVIMVLNVAIFSIAAMVVDIETALYALITYLSASKTVDFIVNGIEEYIGVMVISEYSDDIRKMVINNMGRGVTILKGKRGFGSRGENNDDLELVYTVITRLEVQRLITEISKIDPKAFIIQNSIHDTRGGMIRKRPLERVAGH